MADGLDLIHGNAGDRGGRAGGGSGLGGQRSERHAERAGARKQSVSNRRHESVPPVELFPALIGRLRVDAGAAAAIPLTRIARIWFHANGIVV
ncbi:hypothetical protein GCM10008171_10380 [Methylopila jiangsuensis]|uniref:Uncharacterized protein n=1 Tax=Methylopila jiangsuensis TaxID=586230 RepID=A0A9W6JHC6_9HYPH|nr:hypothetical protein GCM10008171_10380 [Methylopila jiangsuensis]